MICLISCKGKLWWFWSEFFVKGWKILGLCDSIAAKNVCCLNFIGVWTSIHCSAQLLWNKIIQGQGTVPGSPIMGLTVIVLIFMILFYKNNKLKFSKLICVWLNFNMFVEANLIKKILKFTVYTSFQNSILELLFCYARYLSMKGLIPYWKILWKREKMSFYFKYLCCWKVNAKGRL